MVDSHPREHSRVDFWMQGLGYPCALFREIWSATRNLVLPLAGQLPAHIVEKSS